MTQSHHSQEGLRESATFGRDVIYEIQRAARTGIYDIRGWGAKRRVPHFDDLVFLGARHVALSAGRLPRAAADTDVVLGTRYAKKPDPPRHPHYHRGNELWLAVGTGQRSARPRCQRGGHEHHDRRRRDDAGGARTVADFGLSAFALALWHESRRPAEGRCH